MENDQQILDTMKPGGVFKRVIDREGFSSTAMSIVMEAARPDSEVAPL